MNKDTQKLCNNRCAKIIYQFKNIIWRRMKEYCMQGAGIALVAVLIALRQWSLFDKQYLVSEDGAIFISRACEGRISALLTPYAGYYHFATQAITDILYTICMQLNNIENLPRFMWICSIAVSALVAYYFTLERFSWLLPDRIYRLGVCCLVVLLHISEFQDLYGTLTNLQWWFSFYFFLAALQMFHSCQLPQKSEMALLLVLGFSTAGIVPFFLYAVAVVIYRYCKKIAEKGDICKLAVLACPIAVQAHCVLTSERIKGNLMLAEKIKQTLWSYFVLLGKTITSQSTIFYTVRFAIIGMLVFGFILYQMRDKINVALFSLGYAFFIYIFNTFPIKGNANNAAILTGDFSMVHGNVGGRYWFTTLSIFAFLIAVSLAMGVQKEVHKNPTALIVLIVVMITINSRFDMDNYLKLFASDYTSRYSEYSPLFSKDGTSRLRIPLHEPNWGVTFPCPDFSVKSDFKEGIFKVYSINDIEYYDGINFSNDSKWVKIGGYIEGYEYDAAYAMALADGIYYPLYANSDEVYVKEAYQIDKSSILYVNIPSSIINDSVNTLDMVILDNDKQHVVKTVITINRG